ncbi:hypothetical protein AKO1_006725 [Acrasis kona]|uniref:Fascin n=1 Tax=Acrasis kona TaxID=1008807 RepID=A0AAW2Z1S9_9EUKA
MSLAAIIRTTNNTYFSISPGSSHLRHEPQNQHQPASYGCSLLQLFIVDFEHEKVVIRSMHGTFLSARKHNICVMSTDVNPKHWERFVLIGAGVNKLSIKTAHGLYINTNKNNNMIIQGDVREPFTFTFVPVSLKTSRGMLLSASQDDNITQVSRKVPSADEIFHLDYLNDAFYIRSSGNKFLCLTEGDNIRLAEKCNNEDRFIFCKQGDFTLIRTMCNTFLSANQEEGSVIKQTKTIGPNEQFDIFPL